MLIKMSKNDLFEPSPKNNLNVTNKPNKTYGIKINFIRFSKKFLGMLFEYRIPNKISDKIIKHGVANSKITCTKLKLVFSNDVI